MSTPDRVEALPFNKYFMNFEDPEVFREMTDQKNGLDIWLKTYVMGVRDFFSYLT